MPSIPDRLVQPMQPSLPVSYRLGERLSRHWLLLMTIGLGLYVGVPFLAPLFMHWGWTGAGRVIYFIYSWLCHQLPERSYFFFGEKFSYSLAEIQNAWQVTSNPVILRQFIGNPHMGWKVAWSDRMISMFGSMFLLSALWVPLRRWLKRLPLWGLVLFLLPMAVDGTTHFFSDLGGIGLGFRFTNAWLAGLTNHSLPAAFYYGDAWGSFNSLVRLLTGILFGIGMVWFGYPYMELAFNPRHSQPRQKVVSLASPDSQVTPKEKP